MVITLIQNMIQLLETLNLPVVYGRFKSVQNPPYLIILGAGQDGLLADNKNYYAVNKWTLELYFDLKDPDVENSIEQLLINNEIIYTKSEDIYIESEKIFMVIYDV